MRVGKIINKSFACLLSCSVVFGNITPTLAATQYTDSTYSVETQTIDTDSSPETTVYAELGSSFKVTIPKKVTLDGVSKLGNYQVFVEGDIAGTETINVIPEETVLLTTKDKFPVTGSIEQDKTAWTYKEITDNKVLGNGTITAEGITAGEWNGTFYFNINISNCNINVNAKNESGEDLEATATYITGKKKTDLLNNLVESGFIEETEQIDALINVEANDFEGIANTTFNVSNLYNEGDTIVILHFDETRQEWEYIGTETVDANGLVNGDFTSYSPVAFVKVNDDNTLTNIRKKGEWICDEKYIFEGTGTFAIAGGRTYNKVNEGKAVVAVVKDASNRTIPMIASTDPKCVETWCSYNSTTRVNYAQLEYLNTTWYISYGPYSWRENVGVSGFAPIININMNIWTNLSNSQGLASVGLEFLKTIGVR